MLILFSVKNFRSIRDKQELSLVAASDRTRDGADMQLVHCKLPGLSGKRFLHSAALFGANGSGKSNLVDALRMMQELVLESASYSPDKRLPYSPFLLDHESVQKPTECFIAFVWENSRYEYRLSYNEGSIVEEELCSFPKGFRRTLFSRTMGPSGHSLLRGSSAVPISHAVASMLNPNTLFLSLVFHHPGMPGSAAIRPAGDFFQHGLAIPDWKKDLTSAFPSSGEVLDGSQGSDYQQSFVQRMMSCSDLGISSAAVVRKPIGLDVWNAARAMQKTVVFEHVGINGSADIEYLDDSSGTQQLFSLSSSISSTFQSQETLVVDGLDTFLHPTLATEIVRLFETPGQMQPVQLIFTALDPAFMQHDLLGRDQIWLADKDASGSTAISPLLDYLPKEGEPLASGYLLGRYGGTPVLSGDFDNLPST